MGSTFVRVTVLAGADQLDVSLPATRPVAELVPEVIDLLSTEATAGGDPVVWSLSTVRNGTLDPLSTLAEASVPDGATLHLTRATEGAEPPFVDDVLAEMARIVDQDAVVWSDHARATGLGMVAAGVVTALSLLVALHAGVLGVSFGLVAAVCLATGLCPRPVREIVPWAAVPAAAAATWAPAQLVSGAPRVAFTVAVGCAAMALAAVASGRGRPIVTTGWVLAAVLAVSGGGFAAGASPVAWCAWSTVPVVAALFVVPRFAVSASGILAYLRRSEGGEMVSRDQVRRSVRRGRDSADAAVWSLAVLAGMQMLLLSTLGVWEHGLLAAWLAVVVWLRSRSLAHARHTGPLVAAAAVGSVAAALDLPRWLHLGPTPEMAWVVAVSVVLVVVLVAAAAIRPDEVQSAQFRTVVDSVDVPLTLAYLPILVFAQGIYPYFWPH